MRVFSQSAESAKAQRMHARMAWGTDRQAMRSSSSAPTRALTTTNSLPSLGSRVATPASPAGLPSASLPASPVSMANPYEAASIEEKASLRRRVKELESQLKRAVTTIARERKEYQMSMRQERQRREEEEQARRQWRLEMESEVQRARREAEANLSNETALQKSFKELKVMEEQTKALKEHERQQRIQLVRRQALRRIMNAGLVRGWTSLHSAWQQNLQHKRIGARIAARVQRPAAVAAYNLWKHSWEQAHNAAQAKALELRGHDCAALKAELATTQARYEQKLASAEARHAAAEQRCALLASEVASANALLELEQGKAKEERVELLKRQIARRIMHKSTGKAWTAWVAMREDKMIERQRMQQFANRLRSPEKSSAFAFWHEDWMAAVHHARLRELKQRQNEVSQGAEDHQLDLERMRKEHDKELQLVLKERDSYRVQLAELGIDVSALQLKHEQDMAAQNEQRIEHLCNMIARRMMMKDVARGWFAWHASWEENKLFRRRLAAATSRMRCPELTDAFGVWHFIATELNQLKLERTRKKAEKARKETEKALRAMIVGLQADLNEVTAERDLLKHAGHRSNESVINAENRLRELEEAREKEHDARIMAVASSLLRRMIRFSIVQGWVTWHTTWLEGVERKRTLRQAANRITKPKIAHAHGIWKASWQAAERQALLKRQQDREAEYEKARNELARQLDAQAARQEEEAAQRVQHLSEMFARRMLKRDLALGWSSWVDMRGEKLAHRRLLQKAASRLQMPQRSAAFQHWNKSWSEAERARALKRQAQRESELSQGRDALQAELNYVRSDLQRKLDASEAARLELVASLNTLDGGAAEAERLMLKQRALEREQRIQHLSGMIARRMLRKELARFWSCWVETWTEAQMQQRTLQHAASRLRKPALVSSFSSWHADWQVTSRKAQLVAVRSQSRQREAELIAEVDKVRQECKQRIQALESERNHAISQFSKLGGSAESAARALQAQIDREQREKEQRVEHLCTVIGRRMLRRDMARGWIGWVDKWEEKRMQRRKLQQAANRLRTPALSGSFMHWLREWRQAWQISELERHANREAELGMNCASLQDTIQQVRDGYERKLVEAAKAQTEALEKQLVELLGKSAAEDRIREAQEREERLEYMRKRIGRRLMNFEITRGWTKWQQWWEATTYHDRLIRKATGRMSKPALAAAFSFWSQDTAQIKWQKEQERQAQQRASLEQELRVQQLEVGKLSLLTVAQEDELQALRSKAALLQKDIEGKKLALDIAQQERQQLAELEELHKATQEALQATEQQRDEAKQHAISQQTESKELIRRLLAEQRQQAEVDIAQSKQQAERAIEELQQARQELTALHKELSTAKAAAKVKKEKPTATKKPGIVLSGDPNTPLSEQLAEALRSNSTRVLDLFRSWDADGDGEVSRKEFHKAMPALGLEVPKVDVDELFDTWDKDGGGSLAYKELKKILSGASAPKKKLVSLSADDGPIADQLADALRAQATRVFDLFRQWDRDGDGEVSRAEFHRAMPALGFDVPKGNVDELFDQWDKDGGGSLAYKELKKILSSHNRDKAVPPPSGSTLKKVGLKAVSMGKLLGAPSEPSS